MAAISRYIPISLSTPENGVGDILQYTFSFIDQTEILKNGLVCRLWRTLTLQTWNLSNDKNLNQFSQLKQMSAYTSEFKVILLEFRHFPKKPPQQTLGKIPQQTPEKSPKQKTPEQIETSFWQAQGKILTIFKKLTLEDRQNVKT